MKFNSPAEGGLKEFYIDNLMFTDNAPDYAVPAYQDARAPALVDDASTVSVYGDVQTSPVPSLTRPGARPVVWTQPPAWMPPSATS